MRLADLGPGELRRLLRGTGVRLRTGPFVFSLRSPIEAVAEGLELLYAHHPIVDAAQFADYAVEIVPGEGPRRWIKPQCRFLFDGRLVFEPMPVSHAYPLLEWAMNWCVSTQAHHYLVVHAAVLERNGLAVILPAPPGSGKSTLCAGLAYRGWRLLSDELTVIDPATLQVHALCRPVSLKNESIEIMRGYALEARFNRPSEETAKGRVTHMSVRQDQVLRMDEPARPRWVVFPRYVAGSAPRLSAHSPSEAMLELARNAFNYAALGPAGFETLAAVIDACHCHDFEYSRLDDAVDTFERLAAAESA